MLDADRPADEDEFEAFSGSEEGGRGDRGAARSRRLSNKFELPPLMGERANLWDDRSGLPFPSAAGYPSHLREESPFPGTSYEGAGGASPGMGSRLPPPSSLMPSPSNGGPSSTSPSHHHHHHHHRSPPSVETHYAQNQQMIDPQLQLQTFTRAELDGFRTDLKLAQTSIEQLLMRTGSKLQAVEEEMARLDRADKQAEKEVEREVEVKKTKRVEGAENGAVPLMNRLVGAVGKVWGVEPVGVGSGDA